ncbi:hypothetical protein BH18THE2_BH18THE2_42780 [soil metagenome]
MPRRRGTRIHLWNVAKIFFKPCEHWNPFTKYLENRFQVEKRQKENFWMIGSASYRAQVSIGFGRYASGKKWYQICEIFIKLDGLWRHCCG